MSLTLKTTPRVRALAVALLVVASTWVFFRQQINQALAVALFVRSENPAEEVFDELANRFADPRVFLARCWATGKVAHRQLVAAFLKQKAVANPPWFGGLGPLIAAGATDADNSVRELSLATMALSKDPRLLQCAEAQLRNRDPSIRLLGLDYLGKADPAKALPVVVEMLDDPDLQVVARADHSLTRWTGEDFGIRAKLAVSAKIENRQDETAIASADKIRQGIERRKEWWLLHKNDYAAIQKVTPTPEPRDLSRLPVSNFSLLDLNGKRFRLSEFRGKVVLLNFWATWCTACLAEIPDLIALQAKFGDKIVVLGVALDGVPDEHGHEPGEAVQHNTREAAPELNKARDTVRRAVQARGINYTVLLDPEGAVGGRFNGGELPTTVILDANGRICRRFIGERTLSVFEAMIAEAATPAH